MILSILIFLTIFTCQNQNCTVILNQSNLTCQYNPKNSIHERNRTTKMKKLTFHDKQTDHSNDHRWIAIESGLLTILFQTLWLYLWSANRHHTYQHYSICSLFKYTVQFRPKSVFQFYEPWGNHMGLIKLKTW